MATSDFDVKELLSRMTTEEKVGQLIQLNSMFLGNTKSDITGPRQRLGISESMLKKVGSTLNFNGFHEVKAMQDKHLAEDRNRIPLMFMMDVIHGYKTIYPIPLGMGGFF